ncbi:MAG TPA: hypothetical protein VFF91_08785 [Pseudoxanthomonas sp.]|nr:hypothetical protein [Pseudoxanthomonas sp.]
MDRLFALVVAFALAMPGAATAQNFIKDRTYSELPPGRVEALVADYVRVTRGWEPHEYRVKPLKDRKVPVGYLVIYLGEARARQLEGGRVFEIYLDAETGEVVGENAIE